MRNSKKLLKSSPKGISLIEVLISVLISSVIVVAIFMFLSTSHKIFFNQGEWSDAIDDSQAPGVWISKDIRGATEVVDSHGTYNTSENTLILMLPSIDGNEMVIDGNFDYIVYRRNPGSDYKLERIIDGVDGVSARTDGSRVLADNLDSLNFIYYDQNNLVTTNYSTAIGVNFIITSKKLSVQRGNQPFLETYKSWAKLRNKTS